MTPGLVAFVWILVVVAVLASDLGRDIRAGASQGAIMITALISAALCLARASRSSGRRRRAWNLLAAAGLIGLAGNVTAALVPAGDLGEIALVAAVLTGIAALLSFPDRPLRRSQLARMLLDGIVVGGSLLFVSALVIFPGLSAPTDDPILPRATALALPVLDAVLATLAVLLILRSSGSDRVPLALVGLSFTIYAVADLVYAASGSTGDFEFGSLVDVGWVIGYALGGVAACHPTASGGPCPVGPDDADAGREGSPVVGTVVTFGLFIAASVVQVQGSLPTIPIVALVLWFAVIGAVAVRQILLVISNEKLRRGLEHRVRARTAELAAMTHTTQLTLTSVGEGIYGVDRDGLITFINPAGARTLGRHPRDLVGVHAHDLLHAGRPDGMPFPYEDCYISEAISRAITAQSEEDLYVRADGMQVPVEVTASPVVDGGDVTGAVVVFRDVAPRREVDRLKTEFVSVISHELRTPLTSIKGSIGLVAGGAMGPIEPEARRLLDIAGSSVDRLTRLINDILEVERLGSGADPLDLRDVELDGVVHTAVDQVEALATQAGITVTVQSIPGVVRADADRVVQTLVNLLGNALKFTDPGGSVEISARETGTFVEVAVTDTGRGIPSDRLEMIFGRFEQVDSSDARAKGGTGLGLAISRGIVSRHGGRIWAESTLGQGSRFRFTLPSADPVPAPSSVASDGAGDTDTDGADARSVSFRQDPPNVSS